MMEDVLIPLFIGISVISQIILLVAVIFALLGYFGKEASAKQRYYTKAAKLLLIYALMFVVGLGSCLVLVSTGS